MRKLSLFWNIFLPLTGIILLAIAAFGIQASRALRRELLQNAKNDLSARGQILARQIESAPLDFTPFALRSLCQTCAESAHADVAIISWNGRLLADNQSQQTGDDVSSLPEIRAALRGQVSEAQRFSTSAGLELFYVALPLHRNNGEIVACLRLAVPLQERLAAVKQFDRDLWITALILLLVAACGAWAIARRVNRPLAQLQQDVKRLTDNNFQRRLGISTFREFNVLIDGLNDLTRHVEERLQNVALRTTEQEAILDSMREGLVAVDDDDRVLFVNHAAAVLLDSDFDTAQGRLFPAVVRVSQLQNFVEEFRGGDATDAECEVRLISGDQRILQARVVELCDERHRRMGILLVLNDVTRLRRLETVRRDFVANVSHELKTPLTSLKGMVETILEDGQDDIQQAQDFLVRMARNIDRLNAIIDDLLALSRIEMEDELGKMECTECNLSSVIESAVQNTQSLAKERDISVRIQIATPIRASINRTLIEQAISNLLDNAIKYSEPQRDVTIVLERSDAEAVIRVQDRGCGIAPEHLPRLFERFYRVDKARSRKMGGTGLGLAIVKHIAKAHGGHITVESEIDSGSAFSLHLPLT